MWSLYLSFSERVRPKTLEHKVKLLERPSGAHSAEASGFILYFMFFVKKKG